MQVLLLTLVLGAAPADVAVVCPSTFRAALQPWVLHRQRQGYRLHFVSSEGDSGQIQAAVRRLAGQTDLAAVVLFGDADARMNVDRYLRRRCVPTFHLPAKVNVYWGSEPQLASDNPYADLDGDAVPDVPVGRIPADSADELRTVVRKIIDYETQVGHGLWRRRIQFVAGIGGFNKWADSVLEFCARRLITDGVPAHFSTSMTYASWRSPFCPDPRLFDQRAQSGLNQGCLFWVYIGHGNRRSLDDVHLPGARYPIFDTRHVPHLQCASGSPIAFFMACYTGAYDEAEDCLAEELLAAEGGPVGVISGSRVTMPYAMAVLATGMLRECFHHRQPTLGQVLLAAKRRTSGDDPDNPFRPALDVIAQTLSPQETKLSDERLEHVQLFNLLGDPLLRLSHAEPVELDVVDRIEAGGPLKVSGRTAVAGNCIVELVARRDQMRHPVAQRHRFDPRPEEFARWSDEHRRANDRRWVGTQLSVAGGEFHTQLAVPETASGACVLRVFVSGEKKHAMGAKAMVVQPARRASR